MLTTSPATGGPTPDFRAHREALLQRLGADEAVLLFASPHATRNADTEYRYRADSDLYWLTGWTQPECAVFLRAGEKPLTMFVQPRNPEMETWTGRRPGPEGAKARFGADEAFAYDQLESELVRLLQGVSTLHYAFGRDAAADQLVQRAIRKAAKAARRNGADVPELFASPQRLVHELRLHKTPDEIAVLREACRLTALGHVEAMRFAVPGRFEHEVEGCVDGFFRRMGGNGPGYNTIVAGGDNANILHYIDNEMALRDGDLLLIDAGCEYQLYTGDVTRTFPVNGRFTPAQRDVYEIVLRAQQAALAEATVGTPYKRMHDAAVRTLTEGLVSLGILKGALDELVRTEAYKPWYMHGTGHWLGIDVHDAGAYNRSGTSRPLAPGMVLTIEPGLYLGKDDERVPPALRGIGIRIEDDVLVTAAGPEVLTALAPKAIDDVEAAAGGR